MNDVGQLGFPVLGKHSRPEKISLSAIQVSTSQVHSIVLDLENRIWVMGGNYYGQLGTGDSRHKTQPVRIPKYRAMQVSAGASSSFFLKI